MAATERSDHPAQATQKVRIIHRRGPWTERTCRRVAPGAHLMKQLHPHMPDLWTAAELKDVPNGTVVSVGGSVIARQRQGTAKGFCFITLEDETGHAKIWTCLKRKADTPALSRHSPHVCQWYGTESHARYNPNNSRVHSASCANSRFFHFLHSWFSLRSPYPVELFTTLPPSTATLSGQGRPWAPGSFMNNSTLCLSIKSRQSHFASLWPEHTPHFTPSLVQCLQLVHVLQFTEPVHFPASQGVSASIANTNTANAIR
jgi:hypothetical protein